MIQGGWPHHWILDKKRLNYYEKCKTVIMITKEELNNILD